MSDLPMTSTQKSARIKELEANLDDCVSVSYAQTMVADATSELAEENRELEAEALKLQKRFDAMEKALHSITNMAHPLHMEIFNEAMKGLGLEDVAKQMKDSNATSSTVTGKLHR
jgi:hypothetical protein